MDETNPAEEYATAAEKQADAAEERANAPSSPSGTPSKTKPSGGWPALWVLLGVALTLAIVAALRWVDRPPPPVEATPAPTAEEPEPLSSAQVRFAELYLSYLLKTYYVRRRGFCQPLLEKICEAMLRAQLLASPSTCKSLPNDRFVLAIGQYQNRVGLPVDGKAGPETVRLMLGGDFNNREGMARAYCPGWQKTTDAP